VANQQNAIYLNTRKNEGGIKNILLEKN